MTRGITLRYDSLADLAQRGWAGVGSSKTGSQWFTETTDYREAVDLALGGWSQGTRDLATLVERVAPMMADRFPEVGTRTGWTYTLSGAGVLDVAAYHAGQPFMIVGPTCVADTPVVSVAMPAIWSGCTDTSAILAAGAVAAAVVDLLGQRGYSVEVHALAGWARRGYSTRENPDAKVVADVTLKRSTDRLSLEDLAFGLAHPAMSRRFIFAAGETSGIAAEIHCTANGGYGGAGHVWSGSCPALIRGMADIDLTDMAAKWYGTAGDLDGCIGVAVDAVRAWRERS